MRILSKCLMKSYPIRYQTILVFLVMLVSGSIPGKMSLAQQPQDYQLFRQDATYFYHSTEDSYPSVVGLRLDSSVITGEGTEWYNHVSVFQKWISPEMYWCYQPDGPSWMGYKLLIKSNGDNVLYGWCDEGCGTPLVDTILIKTRAMPGDSWGYIHIGAIFGSDTMATVTRHDTMTFLGMTDSIKVIDLGVDSIILSKSHGLVRTLNFRDFFPYDYYDSYDLEGITTPDTVIGTGLMTYGDIYDYEIGDVFHRSSHVDGWPYATLYEVFEVLDKTYSANQDSVHYQMSRIQWFVGPEGTSDPVYDTLEEAYGDLDEWIDQGRLPAETVWGEDSAFFYDYSMYFDVDTYNGRKWIDGSYMIYYEPFPPDSCYEAMGANYTRSVEGCGSYIHIYGDYHDCMPCQQLDYFNKGGEEWGIPYTIPTVIREYEQLDVHIYPLPAEDFVMIGIDRAEIRENLQVTLSDLSGRILEYKIIMPDQVPFKLDLHSKDNGIYLLGIVSGDKIYAGKIVHFIP